MAPPLTHKLFYTIFRLLKGEFYQRLHKEGKARWNFQLKEENRMKGVFDWFQKKQVERTIDALQKNRMPAVFFRTKEKAKKGILEMISPDSNVGIGGSVTLEQLGLIEEMKKQGFMVLNPFESKLTKEEKINLRRKALLSDVFLVSTNAITEEGMKILLRLLFIHKNI